LSVIENSIKKLRGVTAVSTERGATAAALPAATSPEPTSPLDPPCVHKRIGVDFVALRAAGYLPEQGQEPRFAESCHRIKRPLVDHALAAGAEDARLILLSSALPGDGKTFIALNLALSMARERDISVLLIDADLARAQITRVLGMAHEPGLLQALQDTRVEVESLVVETDVANLQVLPAGRPLDGAAELIASARMREIIGRLVGRDPRRLVLFDSPPLLISSEARALAPIAGQIVLIARAGRTPLRAIVDALAHIDKMKLRGLVLNDGHIGNEHGYYDYYGPGDGVSKPAR
jgi:exopolysaccharide/PEP-CTERM locus tyrosine autokinase